MRRGLRMNLLAGMPNEPPDWWKRWRPLRWLAAVVLLLLIAKLLSAFWPVATLAQAGTAAPEPVSVVDAATPAADPVVATAAVAPAETPPAVGAEAGTAVALAPPASVARPEAAKPQPLEIVEEESITPEHVLEAYTARPPAAQQIGRASCRERVCQYV